MEMTKATRKKVKMKLSLSSPTGFGKTYSALLLAYGLVADWKKICVIDTENGSASLYEHLGEYNVIELGKEPTSDDLIQAVAICKKNGIQVVIIDSLYHFWQGVLQYVDSIGGGFQNWKKGSPLWKKIVEDTILGTDMHFICTIRKKQAYEMSKDDKGKTTVEKKGMEDQVREGFDYEMTVAFEIINDKHLVKASKDRTGLFTGKQEFIIGENTGLAIKKWCELGIEALKPKKPLSDAAIKKAIDRYTGGEKDYFDKLLVDYSLTESQIEAVRSAGIEIKLSPFLK